MLANLANVPQSDSSLAEWSFAHMAHHRDISRLILERFRIVLPEFILDPMNPQNFGTFGYQHQILHNDQNSVLGIDGQNLTEVDWNDMGQRTDWIFLNFNEHLKAADILGL